MVTAVLRLAVVSNRGYHAYVEQRTSQHAFWYSADARPCACNPTFSAISLLVWQVSMTNAEEGHGELSEEEMIDDAEVDSMVREAINHVVGEQAFTHSKLD